MLKKLFSFVFCIIFLSACSVGMALSGKKDPDLSVIKKGAYRSEVELQLGSPIKTTLLDNGNTVAVYEYDIGNEPSAGRAVAHGVIDVMTFGLWELVGSPIEHATGNKYQISVTYDKDDRVIPSGKSKKVS